VDLCKLSQEDKRAGVAVLLERIAGLRRRTGLPHRVVVDEAHYFLRNPDVTGQLDLDHGGYFLISYRASELHPEVLSLIEALLVTRETDAAEAEALRKLVAKEWSPEDWAAMLRDLELNEVLLLPGAQESKTDVLRIRIANRLTPHVRHKHKYLEIPVSEDAAFVFSRDGVPTGQRARTLKELTDVLSGNAHSFEQHLANGDFSRWVEEVIGDSELAAEIRSMETDWRAGRSDRPCERITRLIRERYGSLG